MGAAHGHRLHYHGHSPVHRWPAHLKVLGLLGFMVVVVATPKEWFAAFGVYLVVLGAVVALSRVPPTYLLKRLVIEVPFLLFALLLPFVAQGPQIEVLGLTVSQHGLLAAWGLLALFGLLCRFRVAYFSGLIFILVCLLLEHWLARRRSLKWIDTAFFKLNALVSTVFLVVTLAEVVFPGFRVMR